MAELSRSAATVLARAARALKDVCVGAAGADAYRNYVEHLRVRHPGTVPLSRERFAREELAARWDGIKRCC